MSKRLVFVLLLAGVASALADCGQNVRSVPGVAVPQAERTERILATTHLVCPPSALDSVRCFAAVTTIPIRPVADNPATVPGTCTLNAPPCYGPLALQTAYNIVAQSASAGSGMTVAVVDWGGYPSAAADFNLYRKTFGLPAQTLTIVNQAGKPSPLPGTANADAGEQALDVDSVSAICPKCKVVLVEAKSFSTNNMNAAEKTALNAADVVSNSWGRAEYAATSPIFDVHPGKVVTASAMDDGAGGFGGARADQPCSFSGVVCVGGTNLQMSVVRGVPTRASETVWNWFGTSACSDGKCATGSGCSAIVAKPPWQHDSGCTMRTADDLSADAIDLLGVFKGPCCVIFHGTSVASPLIAAMYALAGSAANATPATLYHWGGRAYFNDITQGTNQFQGITFMCPKKIAYVCNAGPGYDGPTGWGTPNGLGAFATPSPSPE